MTEPEELIEAKLIAILSAAVPSVDVVGALSPAPEGELKQSPDTYISVFVDIDSQNIDFTGPGIPCTYSVRIVVHYANADDKSGAFFRDTCRAVRATFNPLLGDGCATLDGDGFECDSFRIAGTSTVPEMSSADGGMSKTYKATVVGRYIEPSSNEESNPTKQEET